MTGEQARETIRLLTDEEVFQAIQMLSDQELRAAQEQEQGGTHFIGGESVIGNHLLPYHHLRQE